MLRDRQTISARRFAVVVRAVLVAVAISAVGVGYNANVAAGAPQEQSSSCDSNYSGACVPIDSDVDCAGGSGNGPSYVSGPVTVVGKDIYKLDNDGNGTGCE